MFSINICTTHPDMTDARAQRTQTTRTTLLTHCKTKHKTQNKTHTRRTYSLKLSVTHTHRPQTVQILTTRTCVRASAAELTDTGSRRQRRVRRCCSIDRPGHRLPRRRRRWPRRSWRRRRRRKDSKAGPADVGGRPDGTTAAEVNPIAVKSQHKCMHPRTDSVLCTTGG